MILTTQGIYKHLSLGDGCWYLFDNRETPAPNTQRRTCCVAFVLPEDCVTLRGQGAVTSNSQITPYLHNDSYSLLALECCVYLYTSLQTHTS